MHTNNQTFLIIEMEVVIKINPNWQVSSARDKPWQNFNIFFFQSSEIYFQIRRLDLFGFYYLTTRFIYGGLSGIRYWVATFI